MEEIFVIATLYYFDIQFAIFNIKCKIGRIGLLSALEFLIKYLNVLCK